MIPLLGIPILAILVTLWIVWALRQAAPPRTAARITCLILVVLLVQLGLAASGVLWQWDRTPAPILPMMAVTMGLTLALAFSATGRAMAAKLSFVALIGAQAFRLPLELVMHQAAEDGLMPVQMSYSGSNFDILSGISAILVAFAAWKGMAPRWLLLAWNAFGSALLLVIVAVAVASTPMFAAFGQDRLNTWIADPPYVWLPGALVPGALLGHILIWRKLFLRSV